MRRCEKILMAVCVGRIGRVGGALGGDKRRGICYSGCRSVRDRPEHVNRSLSWMLNDDVGFAADGGWEAVAIIVSRAYACARTGTPSFGRYGAFPRAHWM